MHREWRRKSDERNWLDRIAVSIFSLQPRNDDKVNADQRNSVHSILEEWNKAGRSAGASTCENSNLWLNAITHCTKVVGTNWTEEVTILCHIVHKQATQLNIVFPKTSVDGLLAFFLDAVQSGIVNKRVLLAIASVLYGNRNEISDQRRIALFGERGLIVNVMERELQRNRDEHDVAELEYAAAQCCYCAIKTHVNDSTRSQPKNVAVGRDEREALQVCECTFARTVCAIVTDGGERQYAADSLRRKTLLICLNGLSELQSAFNWQLTAEPAPLCSALCALLCFPNQLAEAGPAHGQQGTPTRVKSTNATESETDSQIEPLTSGCDSPADRSETDKRSGSSSDQKRNDDRPSSRLAVESGSRIPSDGERSRDSVGAWKRSRRVVGSAARAANWQDSLAQSRIRSAALLSQIVKSVNERSKLTAIWSVFFSASPSLKHAESAPYYAQLLRVVSRATDNELRVRLNLIATLCSLLDKAKWCWLPARDEPQLRSNYAFIPYSVQLATILRELHRKLFELIATEKRGTDHTLLVQLVKCLAALIGITPFDKLRPSTSTGGYSSLAGRIVAECASLLDRRDANLKVAVLECFSALQKAKLSIAELQSAFDATPQPQSRFRRLSNAGSTSANTTNGTWLIDTACALVYNANEPGDVHDSMPVRIEALRLLGMISQHRFEMLKAAACFAKLSELADAVLCVRNVDTQTRDLQVSTVRLLQQVICAVQQANEKEAAEPDQFAINFVSQQLERCVLRFLASPTAHVLVRSQLFQLVSAVNNESLWNNVTSQTRERLLELTLDELEAGARVGAKNSCAADALCAASAFLSCSVFLSADADASYRMPRGAALLQAVLSITERLVENPDWSSAGWQSVLKLTEALLRFSEALSRTAGLIQLTAAHHSSMLQAPLTVFARERDPLNANRKSSDKIVLNLARCLVNLIGLLRLSEQTAVADDPHVLQLLQQVSTALRFARERMSDTQLKLAVRAPCCSVHLAVLNNDFLTFLLSVNTAEDRRSNLYELRLEFECLCDVLCEMFATESAGATAGSESFLNGVLEACIACRNDTQKRLLFGADKRRFSTLFGSALRLLIAARELTPTLASTSTRPMPDEIDRPKDGGCLLTRTLRCLLHLARSLDLSDLCSSQWSAELASDPLTATSDDRVSPALHDALSRVAENHGDDYLACCKHLTGLLEVCPQNASSSRFAIERLIVLLSI